MKTMSENDDPKKSRSVVRWEKRVKEYMHERC